MMMRTQRGSLGLSGRNPQRPRQSASGPKAMWMRSFSGRGRVVGTGRAKSQSGKTGKNGNGLWSKGRSAVVTSFRSTSGISELEKIALLQEWAE